MNLSRKITAETWHAQKKNFQINTLEILFFFFLISNKDVYSKNYLMHNGIRHIKDYKKKGEKTKRKLITKERTKKHGERSTRVESPSPRPVKKGDIERSEQLVINAFQVLKCPPISLPPNTPR